MGDPRSTEVSELLDDNISCEVKVEILGTSGAAACDTGCDAQRLPFVGPAGIPFQPHIETPQKKIAIIKSTNGWLINQTSKILWVSSE